MHFITKILQAAVILHVAFQGASSAIMRGRSGEIDSIQEAQLSTRALTDQLEDLDNQLGEFLSNYKGGHLKPDGDTTSISTIATADIEKRQNLQISQQALQDLLKLIQSIETQISAIIASGGSSPSGGAVQTPAPAITGGNPAPVATPGPGVSPVKSANPPVSNLFSASNPVAPNPGATNPPAASNPVASNPSNPGATNNPGVGPIVPAPFLTNSGAGAGGAGNPMTTAYGTATTTDGSPAGAPAKARDVHSHHDDPEDSDLDGSEEDAEVVPAVEPRAAEHDGDVEDVQSAAESWRALTRPKGDAETKEIQHYISRRLMTGYDGRERMNRQRPQ
ncbi:hypothetical protein CGMCC3_g6333 [Colletotrichum fructicola]|uniref:Uncharacterized protein n=1 Tax=Colletotrichum fructicola (strain Nara gc5) TaxID=1213859 RepID=A0A7J6JC62_COLFN|nr:uncharacterized protein CGMCC3_g6333 [Colletotrichum fructicola]KAE9577601.1 hypothetical protein CGMCC3_g6333 [Colletotrichum fructicola]KAF4419691.1 hypothetical protein CFRS1_v005728 [Colletotrichum fructicola]KAF4487559.1 hypothetical protein CGGC5_v006026 [Colletotrichum fructicola Nara gc5]KAF5486175.1 hypothetical protein CGCF413_v013614 [Colletotrichum fructicola]